MKLKKKIKAPAPPQEVVGGKKCLKKNNTSEHTTEELPVFIIRTTNTLGDNRYLLITKDTFACISAQSSEEGMRDCITRMIDRHGSTLYGLTNYIEESKHRTTYDMTPNEKVQAERRALMSSDYDYIIYEALDRSMSKKKKLKKKNVSAARN